MPSSMSRASEKSSGKGSARGISKLIEIRNGQLAQTKKVLVKVNGGSNAKPTGTISMASIGKLGTIL